jgi:hypothetical protein
MPSFECALLKNSIREARGVLGGRVKRATKETRD